MSDMGRKATTVHFDPDLHRALKLRAVDAAKTLSDLVNDAVRQMLREEAEDLAELEKRASEPTIDFEQFVKDLRASGKL